MRFIRGHSGRGKQSRFCVKGHDKDVVGRRSNGACNVCARARATRWRKENPDKQRAASDRWTNENPERVRAKAARHREDGRKSLYGYRYKLRKRKEALMRDIEASGYTTEEIRSV